MYELVLCVLWSCNGFMLQTYECSCICSVFLCVCLLRLWLHPLSIQHGQWQKSYSKCIQITEVFFFCLVMTKNKWAVLVCRNERIFLNWNAEYKCKASEKKNVHVIVGIFNYPFILWPKDKIPIWISDFNLFIKYQSNLFIEGRTDSMCLSCNNSSFHDACLSTLIFHLLYVFRCSIK